MRSKVIIVDNFYTKPERVRERALASAFADIAKTDFPGYASRVHLDTAMLRTRFSELVGSQLSIDAARFSWGSFRFITKESGQRPTVHADAAVDWAGMVYLTADAPMCAGTAFFRHKETGLEAPPTNRQARALGYADASEFDDKVIRRDKVDFSKWERTTVIAPVFNRLILFRGGEFYHAPLGGLGDCPKTARLTHVFFFNEQPQIDIKWQAAVVR